MPCVNRSSLAKINLAGLEFFDIAFERQSDGFAVLPRVRDVDGVGEFHGFRVGELLVAGLRGCGDQPGSGSGHRPMVETRHDFELRIRSAGAVADCLQRDAEDQIVASGRGAALHGAAAHADEQVTIKATAADPSDLAMTVPTPQESNRTLT